MLVRESPGQLVGRGLKQGSRNNGLTALGESPGQLVGRGLKQPHRQDGPDGCLNRPANWSGAD